MCNPLPTQFSLLPVLINVFGVSSIGKSSALAVLYQLVKQSPTFHQINYYRFNSTDFSAIFDYKGKRVGIMTMGDPGCEDEVQDFLGECNSNSCTRIFTASRTRGETIGKVIDFANTNGYIFIETSPLHMRFPNGYNGNFEFMHDAFAELLEKLI